MALQALATQTIKKKIVDEAKKQAIKKTTQEAIKQAAKQAAKETAKQAAKEGVKKGAAHAAGAEVTKKGVVASAGAATKIPKKIPKAKVMAQGEVEGTWWGGGDSMSMGDKNAMPSPQNMAQIKNQEALDRTINKVKTNKEIANPLGDAGTKSAKMKSPAEELKEGSVEDLKKMDESSGLLDSDVTQNPGKRKSLIDKEKEPSILSDVGNWMKDQIPGMKQDPETGKVAFGGKGELAKDIIGQGGNTGDEEAQRRDQEIRDLGTKRTLVPDGGGQVMNDANPIYASGDKLAQRDPFQSPDGYINRVREQHENDAIARGEDPVQMVGPVPGSDRWNEIQSGKQAMRDKWDNARGSDPYTRQEAAADTPNNIPADIKAKAPNYEWQRSDNAMPWYDYLKGKNVQDPDKRYKEQPALWRDLLAGLGAGSKAAGLTRIPLLRQQRRYRGYLRDFEMAKWQANTIDKWEIDEVVKNDPEFVDAFTRVVPWLNDSKDVAQMLENRANSGKTLDQAFKDLPGWTDSGETRQILGADNTSGGSVGGGGRIVRDQPAPGLTRANIKGQGPKFIGRAPGRTVGDVFEPEVLAEQGWLDSALVSDVKALKGTRVDRRLKTDIAHIVNHKDFLSLPFEKQREVLSEIKSQGRRYISGGNGSIIDTKLGTFTQKPQKMYKTPMEYILQSEEFIKGDNKKRMSLMKEVKQWDKNPPKMYKFKTNKSTGEMFATNEGTGEIKPTGVFMGTDHKYTVMQTGFDETTGEALFLLKADRTDGKGQPIIKMWRAPFEMGIIKGDKKSYTKFGRLFKGFKELVDRKSRAKASGKIKGSAMIDLTGKGGEDLWFTLQDEENPVPGLLHGVK